MSTTRDYLERRRAAVRKEMQPLENTAAKLRAELASVDSKLHSLTKEADDIEKALQAVGSPRARTDSDVTIKEAVLEILRSAPDGMTSAQLLAALNDRFFDGNLVRTSMSPQLARLWHKNNKITYRGGRYFLA